MNAYLREVTMEDAEMILKWRNDVVTRENSFFKDEIALETHKNWLSGKLTDENCALYILEDGGECVGHLRIDKIGEVGELSYMIAPDRRGRGYGRKMIELAESVVGRDIKVLTGLVKEENVPSGKCFLANHYNEIRGGNIICYIKSL